MVPPTGFPRVHPRSKDLWFLESPRKNLSLPASRESLRLAGKPCGQILMFINVVKRQPRAIEQLAPPEEDTQDLLGRLGPAISMPPCCLARLR